MTIAELVESARQHCTCVVFESVGAPISPDDVLLASDLEEFYSLCGGMQLFNAQEYPISISKPSELVRANPIIIGDDCSDDITHNWFIVAQAGEQYITIDLSRERSGRCYDSFWDRHGVRGECPIIADSFTKLLDNLLNTNGGYWYWLRNGFVSLGDAYD